MQTVGPLFRPRSHAMGTVTDRNFKILKTALISSILV
jgi:hypothetical protein